MLTPTTQKSKPAEPSVAGAEKVPRKRRKSAVYDAEGNEVLITMMCLKCRAMKPLAMFGLRKMADGAIRNQPWCRTCRSGASPKKKKGDVESVETALPAEDVIHAEPAPSAPAPVSVQGATAALSAPVVSDDAEASADADADSTSDAAAPQPPIAS